VRNFGQERVVSVGTIAREDQNRMHSNLAQIVEERIKQTDFVGFLKEHPQTFKEIQRRYAIGQALEKHFFEPKKALNALKGLGVNDTEAEKILREYYQAFGFEDMTDPIAEIAYKLTPGSNKEQLLLFRGLSNREASPLSDLPVSEDDLDPRGRAQIAYQEHLASYGVDTQNMRGGTAGTQSPMTPNTALSTPAITRTQVLDAPSITMPPIFNITPNMNPRTLIQPQNTQTFRLGLEIGAAHYKIQANVLNTLEREMVRTYKEAGRGLAYLPLSLALPINKAGELTLEQASRLSETQHRFYLMGALRSLTDREKTAYKGRMVLAMPLASVNIPAMNNVYGQIRGAILQSVQDAKEANQSPVRWALFKLDKGVMALIPLFYNKASNRYIPITTTLTATSRDGTARGTYSTLGIFFHESALNDLRSIVRNLVAHYESDANPRGMNEQSKAKIAAMKLTDIVKWLNDNNVIPIIQPFGD
jgi:hypothetical protein